MASSTSTKGQVWSLDLMVAILIFVVALLLFYRYSVNAIDIEEKDTDNLLLDARLISSYLVSEGFPADWTKSNVTLIGLTDGSLRLDKDKVEDFYDLATYNYTSSRRLLSTMNDYYVYFENKNGSLFEIGGVYGMGKNITVENPGTVIKVERFVVYNSTILKMKVLVW